MKLGLRGKVLVIATAVMLLAMAAVIATSAALSAREQAKALKSRSLAIGQSLELQLERLLHFGIRLEDLLGFEEQCREVVEAHPGIGIALVAARDGRVIFHNDPEGERSIADPALLRAIASGTEQTVTALRGGEPWHHAVTPASTPQGEHAGSIVIGYPAAQVAAGIRSMLGSVLGVALPVLALGLLLLHLALRRFVTNPLDALIGTIETLRQGPWQVGHRAPAGTDDEPGRLGAAFNGLIDELQATSVSKTELEAALEELRRVSDALDAQKERAEVTLRSIGDAVLTTDAAGRVQYLNPAAEQLLGCPLEAALGRPVAELLTLVDARTGEPVADPLDPAGHDPGADEGAADLLRHDGVRVAVDHLAAPMRDRRGRLSGHVLTLRDVSAERSLVQRRVWEAAHDALTGLPNRRRFGERVEAALASARGTGRQHVVCFMDLDRFKLVNDACGHAAGDELLRDVAALMKSRVRESDTLARLGGDEFALLLEGCSVERAQRIAAELLAAVADYRFEHASRLFSVGLSIGLAALDGDSSSAEILARADTACYWAKEQGRNRCCVYHPGDGDAAARRRESGWAARIQSALQDERFELHFQDYLALGAAPHAGGHHIEVLLRMVDEDGALVPPASFIPAAERYRLMPAIDRWVIRRVFAGYRALAAERGGGPLTCAINLSATSLEGEGLAGFVREQFEAHALPPRSICFEISESAAVGQPRRVGEFVRACRELGILFALDDVGTGTNAFAHLRSLTVDYLKIDGSFVRNMERDGLDRAMIETISRIGQVMGIKTVAEYAESGELIESLRELGIDYAQGYGVGLPRPLFAPVRAAVPAGGERESAPS
ncbi:EAL domain-containing protein [Caldimonas tepidiphila]|uniref:EAL domain-containing protein n=1 Tax=Caldimonas tepidiphila TaxID=2315841 RepID=UPI000E5A8D9B|nr:EAL domain-containing protein [Caldimonas tepidiphila]